MLNHIKQSDDEITGIYFMPKPPASCKVILAKSKVWEFVKNHAVKMDVTAHDINNGFIAISKMYAIMVTEDIIRINVNVWNNETLFQFIEINTKDGYVYNSIDTWPESLIYLINDIYKILGIAK